jgi:hypothetical protein
MKVLSLIFVLMTWSYTATACTCDWSSNFFQLCAKSDVVLKFKVQGYEDYDKTDAADRPLTLVVEILEVYKGLISGTEMRFEGDNGTFCRKFVDQFKIGREYYFQYNYPVADELPILNICGEYDVLITGDNAQGSEWQENSTAKMTLDAFEDSLESKMDGSLNASYLPYSNFNGGTARTYSDWLIYTLFGVLGLLLFVFVRILAKSRGTVSS